MLRKKAVGWIAFLLHLLPLGAIALAFFARPFTHAHWLAWAAGGAGLLLLAGAVATLARTKLQRSSEAATRGWLLTAGQPQVAPGDNGELSGMPQSSLDGSYRVDEIIHEFDARRGYRSRLRVVNAGAGGGTGGLADLIGGLL